MCAYRDDDYVDGRSRSSNRSRSHSRASEKPRDYDDGYYSDSDRSSEDDSEDDYIEDQVERFPAEYRRQPARSRRSRSRSSESESDEEPRSRSRSRHRSDYDEGYSDRSNDSGSRRTRPKITTQSKIRPTSGTSLTHSDGSTRQSLSSANSSWDTSNVVSKKEARTHHKRHSKKRGRAVQRKPKYAPIRRLTNTSASDLSCFPLPDWKKRLRVDYDLDWSKNYWKTDFVPEGKDKEEAWSPSLVPNMDTVMKRTASNILRRAQVSHIPEDASVSEDEEEEWVEKRLALLAAAEKTKGELTEEMKAIVEVADSAYAPTTTMTMADDFKEMSRHHLTSGDTDVTSLLKSLDGESRRRLTEEMRKFREEGLVHQSNLYDAGYDMLQDHGTLSWMATDKYTKNDHAADILRMWIDDKRVICDSREARNKFLDNGKDIDAPEEEQHYLRDYLVSEQDTVAERDHTKDTYLPTTQLTDLDTSVMRFSVLSDHNSTVKEIEKMLVNPGGTAPSDAPYSRIVDQTLQKKKINETFFKALEKAEKQKDPRYRNYYQEQAVRKLEKSTKKVDRMRYLDEEEWASLYPTISQYKAYSEALSAGKSVARKWWHENSEVPEMLHRRLPSQQ